jgi:rhamnose transport system permease protein
VNGGPGLREAALAALIIALTLAVGARAPAFLTPGNLANVLNETAFLFMMALAQTLVILTRGIDLSVAATLALTGMLTGLVSQANPDLPAAAFLVLGPLIGLGLGLINGGLIGGLGIPPIVATLGTLAVFRGMIVVIGGGDQVNASEMGAAFAGFPKLTVLGLSSVFWIAVLLAVAAHVLLSRARIGRELYAVGGNPEAARYCGVALAPMQVLVYALSGAVAGLCGYLWVARYGVAYSEIAVGYELTVIAACVIGGVSIGGGAGTAAGALLGALFLGVIVNALPVMQVSPFWQMAIAGAVILAAVVLNARAEARPEKLILPEARRAAAARGGRAR